VRPAWRASLGGVLLTAVCAGQVPASASESRASGSVDTYIDVDAAQLGPAVNRLVLGSNVQWVYGGDNLLRDESLEFDPAMLERVRTMHPTVLRYPGGDQSDVYDWRRGVGRSAERGPNRMAPGRETQITYMGSGELLALAATLDAAPLFTVNVISGTPQDAADWVRQTNVTGLFAPSGRRLPKVIYWEIGNEPYLPNPDGSAPRHCQLDPALYAARINAYAAAMRAVDPSLKIGIALATDRQNGIAFVSPACRGFSTTVLANLTAQVDFVSVHDAYLPYDPTGRDHPAADEFAAAMASSESVQADLAALRALLQPFPSVARLPFALTEFNASFSLAASSAFVHSMASPMGALYVADILRMLAGRDDILMANTWSLSANDHWGAIHAGTAARGPYGRPSFEVVRLFGEALQGVRVPAGVTAPTFAAPALGFSRAASGVPLVAALATESTASSGRRTLRLLLLNKDYRAAHVAAIGVAHASITAVHRSALTALDVLADDDTPGLFERSESDPDAGKLAALTLPAHSITLLSLRLASRAP
jgi:alpha-N-arabinofuranosidase